MPDFAKSGVLNNAEYFATAWDIISRDHRSRMIDNSLRDELKRYRVKTLEVADAFSRLHQSISKTPTIVERERAPRIDAMRHSGQFLRFVISRIRGERMLVKRLHGANEICEEICKELEQIYIKHEENMRRLVSDGRI